MNARSTITRNSAPEAGSTGMIPRNVTIENQGRSAGSMPRPDVRLMGPVWWLPVE